MLRVGVNDTDRIIAVEMGQGGCRAFWPVIPDAVALIRFNDQSQIQNVHVLQDKDYYEWIGVSSSPPGFRFFDYRDAVRQTMQNEENK